jgi:hypothetical protein
MRIWSLHPKYLDSKGLVALWREALLAKQVLKGTTKGYKNHPQLERFKNSKNPVDCINTYLNCVYKEALQRGYNFSKEKIDKNFKNCRLYVTSGQLKYEVSHLLGKLKKRDFRKYDELPKMKRFSPHPMFKIKPGGIEQWERI